MSNEENLAPVEPEAAPPAPSWLWMKDSTGHASASLTLVTVSFWIVTASFILSLFQKVGPFVMRPYDVAAATSYFTPLLALYFGRRFTDAKYSKD